MAMLGLYYNSLTTCKDSAIGIQLRAQVRRLTSVHEREHTHTERERERQTDTHTHTYIHMFTHVSTNPIHIPLNTHRDIYMHICTYAHTHIQTYIYTFTTIPINILTCT